MPIRVLHIINGMGSGGAEALLMNWYRTIDRSLVQFDFLLRSHENIYDNEIRALGGRVYYTAEYPKRYFTNKKETESFFRQHMGEYEAIHVHGNALLYINVFDIAKKYGIKNRIMHSHSIKTKNRVFKVLHNLNKKKISKKATAFLACSQEAGRWMFPEDVEFEVIPNGIDVERFKYNLQARCEIRDELNIKDQFIIGHIGRFLDVKNHIFLLDVFEKVCNKREDAVLILVGVGPLEQSIKDEVKARGLEEKVHFLGVRKDTEKIYSAMDVFALPSKYEGLSIVLIEAQASGLYSVASEFVPKESRVTDRISYLSIKSAEDWVDALLKQQYIGERSSCWKQVVKSGFDIKTSVERLQKYYEMTM